MDATPPIDELRRRVEADPASIAFAQLAEEYRRAGRFDEAVQACRAGLAMHPDYLSARVTLGRALLALARVDEARVEFKRVLAADGSDLPSTRALADLHRASGDLHAARRGYQAALALAPNDPELERALATLVGPAAPPDAGHASADRARAVATIAALERWLEGIHAARADRHA